MSNMIRHSHIPVLKNITELGSIINVSNAGMPPPSPVIFDRTQFTL
jgi:hypothetical protein